MNYIGFRLYFVPVGGGLQFKGYPLPSSRLNSISLKNLSTYYRVLFALNEDAPTPQPRGSYVKTYATYVNTSCALEEVAHSLR
jgi:hypothetical protein